MLLFCVANNFVSKFMARNTEFNGNISFNNNFNSHLSTPKSRLSTPTSHLLTPNSQLSTPNSQLPSPNSHLPTLTSQLSTPTSQLSTLFINGTKKKAYTAFLFICFTLFWFFGGFNLLAIVYGKAVIA